LAPSGSGSAALEEAQAAANEIAKQQLEIAKRQQGMAEERYNWWKENYQPMEMELLNRAKAGEDVSYAAQRAGVNQDLADKMAKEGYRREMSRLGINADDERYKDLMGNWDLYKQAAQVGARNMARQETIDKNRALRMQVAGIGTGVPAQALSVYGGAAQSNAMGAGTRQGGAEGLAGAYNAGQTNRLRADQFNADLAARQNQLAFGQQELSSKANLFDMGMRSQQRAQNWQNNTAAVQGLGQLAGLGLGYGLSSYWGAGAGASGGGGGGGYSPYGNFAMGAMTGGLNPATSNPYMIGSSSNTGSNNQYGPLIYSLAGPQAYAGWEAGGMR
jgi:hypothetical protein